MVDFNDMNAHQLSQETLSGEPWAIHICVNFVDYMIDHYPILHHTILRPINAVEYCPPGTSISRLSPIHFYKDFCFHKMKKNN